MRGSGRKPAVMLLVLCAGLVVASPIEAQTPLPAGFVRLGEVAPTVRQDMRYAGAINFTGRPVPGYTANVCILARPVALALARVQATLAPRGLTLVMLDCYRPERATRAFMAWAARSAKPGERQRWHPRIDRSDVVPLGYVSRSSSHSRGVAVDLTLARIAARTTEASAAPVTKNKGAAGASDTAARVETCRAPGAERALIGALEMGSGYDCFDETSHTAARDIEADARANRRLLLAAMQAEGFVNYRREWWHFTLNVPGFARAHDFPVD